MKKLSISLCSAFLFIACKDDKNTVNLSSSTEPTILSSSSSLAISSTELSFEEPKILGAFGHQTLYLGRTATQALQAFDPQFKPWQLEDYLPQMTTVEDFEEAPTVAELQARAPFAVLIDLNQDHQKDLIVHGRNAKMERFLALLSSPQGYEVESLRDVEIQEGEGALVAKENDWVNGKKNHGLYCYLDKTDSKEWDFALACAQLGDSTGGIQNDPYWKDFRYKKGEWITQEADL